MKLGLYLIVGQERGKLDELVLKGLYKLIVYVRYPGLYLDRNIFKHKIDALFLLKHRMDIYHTLVLQPLKQLYFLYKLRMLV